MEKRDLYNENRELTGEFIYKGEKVPRNRYYLTVIVWIQNLKNEFLLQLTSPQKEHKWATTGGHLKTKETSLQGIVREIKEELGIKIYEDSLSLFKTIKTEDDFVDFYYLRQDFDINDIKVQEEEVEEVRWFTKEEIDELIKNRSFLPAHLKFYYDYLSYLENKGSNRDL
jgi:ADP-ribose pyrophosphatase YjhB (NUDIX family)